MSQMYHLCRGVRHWVLLLICLLPLWLAANNRLGPHTSSITDFSAAKLTKLNNHNTPAIIKELGLQSWTQSIHRSWRKSGETKSVFVWSGDAMTSVWSAVHPIVSLPHPQNTDTPFISSSGTGVWLALECHWSATHGARQSQTWGKSQST